MHVLWISDFGINHNIGGAQRSNDLIIQEGRSQGHIIQAFHHDTDPQALNKSYDLLVSSNLDLLSRQRPDIIDYISTHPNHVRLEHDANRYLPEERRQVLFGSCKKTIFLTQFHYDQFIKMYGPIFHNVEIIPDPIDTTQFYDMKNPREDKILNVGFMHQLKGTNNLFEYIYNNPDLNFVMASWGDQQYERIARSFHNVEWIAPIPHQQMPELYNKYTTMYYHPVFYEPFCRAVGESLLCGMNINSNNLVGSLHYYNEIGEDQFATQCNQATQLFWSSIDELCNSNS